MTPPHAFHRKPASATPHRPCGVEKGTRFRAPGFEIVRTAAVAMLFVAGCAAKTPAPRELTDSGRDLGPTRMACKGPGNVIEYVRSPRNARSKRKTACRRLERMEAMAAAEAAACSDVVESFDRTHDKDQLFFETMAHRFAECDHYDALFERIAHYGDSGEGAAILEGLESEGVPLAQQWTQYLETHTGKAFLALESEQKMFFAGRNLAKWMRSTKLDVCSPAARSALGGHEPVLLGLQHYFSMKRCDGLPELASAAMQARMPDLRSWGCRTSVTVGNADALPKMLDLAASDGHSSEETKFVDGAVVDVTHYPVRSACTSSVRALRDVLSLQEAAHIAAERERSEAP